MAKGNSFISNADAIDLRRMCAAADSAHRNWFRASGELYTLKVSYEEKKLEMQHWAQKERDAFMEMKWFIESHVPAPYGVDSAD